MNMACFWRFLRDTKIIDDQINLATVNRVFARGMRSHFTLMKQMKQTFPDFATSPLESRVLTPVSQHNLDYVPDIVMEDFNMELVDLHSPERVVLFR